MNVYGKYFKGEKISQEGLSKGFVDYATLARTFDSVLANDIVSKTLDVVGEWEQLTGLDIYDDNTDVYQWYIVSEEGAELLQELDEIVLHNSDLGLYVWGVDFYGTSWDYVLTPIRIAQSY